MFVFKFAPSTEEGNKEPSAGGDFARGDFVRGDFIIVRASLSAMVEGRLEINNIYIILIQILDYCYPMLLNMLRW